MITNDFKRVNGPTITTSIFKSIVIWLNSFVHKIVFFVVL